MFDFSEDVFALIVDKLLEDRGSLANLSRTSRNLRSICAPFLFARCVAHPDGISGIPPSVLRPYIRHITYIATGVPIDKTSAAVPIATMLDHLPAIRSVTIVSGHPSVIWETIDKCLATPAITSICVEHASFISAEPYPDTQTLAIRPNSLSRFSYIAYPWREITHSLDRRGYEHMELEDLYPIETQCLSRIVLAIHTTAEHLSLPMKTAPLAVMANLPWPRLRRLSIRGKYLNDSQETMLRPLLTSVPDLRRLSIMAGREIGSAPGSLRYPILGRYPEVSHIPETWKLESLEVAYPDPEDTLFSVDTSHLVHLSLRDWPRYYHDLGGIHSGFFAPILTATECLHILQRMQLPRLSHLELVYIVHAPDEDDELLHYLPAALPQLAHLTLHRYRADRRALVDYVSLTTTFELGAHGSPGLSSCGPTLTNIGHDGQERILRILTGLRLLRTAHLNLDFHDECPAYVEFRERAARYRWMRTLRDTRGWEVVNIMEACPLLEFVALICHGYQFSTWVEFHPRRCAKPRLVHVYDKRHRYDPLHA
ncbi:hypothetical protein C8Q76DRAFT_803771 [Earliella scabrosa]|nr:hypothetical protein C8Q76DRAFT_803771 [Earliella scabrosa]